MIITRCDIFKYSLPLTRALGRGSQPGDLRLGLMMRLTSETGAIGWGEAAPLPGFSVENFDDALEQLKTLAVPLVNAVVPDDLHQLDGRFDRWLTPLGLVPSPSVSCALEMATLDLAAVSADMPLARLLTDRPLETVRLNGLIVDDEGVTEIARRLRRDGYRAVKLKVGRGEIETDIARTRDVFRELGSGTTLRLDANRAWTLDDAGRFAEAITDCEIEYIEEPLADISQLAEFMQAELLPVALDESLIAMRPQDLAEYDQIKALVLKPTLLGGFERAAALATAAKELGIKVIISSSFESSVGIAALAQLAAALDSFNSPTGLDTLDWFERDLLLEPIDHSGGRMRIGQLARVATTVDESRLTRVPGD